VPLFQSGPDVYAEVKSQAKVPGDLDHRSSKPATLRYNSSILEIDQVPPNTPANDFKNRHDGRVRISRKILRTEQTKDIPLKQEYMRSDAGAFATVVLAQRWLGKLRLQYPHPMTRNLQQASETSYDLHKFIPDSRVRDIIRDKDIQTELSKSNKSMRKPTRMLKTPVVPENYASYRKILAILYLMKRPSKIRLFVRSRLCDDHLPLKKTLDPSGVDHVATLTSRRMLESPCIKFKRKDDAEEFLERQWSVLAPVFDRPAGIVSHKDLEPEVVLPFLSETTIAKVGGSSKVFKAKIHPDHHHLDLSEVSTKSIHVYEAKRLIGTAI
jgi:hypothetical protein